MRAKNQTKIYSFIQQTQQEALKTHNPENQFHIGSKQSPRKMKSFKIYRVFDTSVEPSIFPQKQQTNGSKTCDLEVQNYRLIEFNYNLLKKHSSLVSTMKNSLDMVIESIEAYRYVQAIKIVYNLLDNIKNTKEKQTHKFSSFNPIGEFSEPIQEKPVERKKSQGQKKIEKKLSISSMQISEKIEMIPLQRQFEFTLGHTEGDIFKKYSERNLRNVVDEGRSEVSVLPPKTQKLFNVNESKQKKKLKENSDEAFYRFMYVQAEAIENSLW